MKHNCSIFHSHYKTEVSGATWSGKVAEQEEVPQEGDQAGPHRHHGLHHLLAAPLGHPDRSDQVSPLSSQSDVSSVPSHVLGNNLKAEIRREFKTVPDAARLRYYFQQTSRSRPGQHPRHRHPPVRLPPVQQLSHQPRAVRLPL